MIQRLKLQFCFVLLIVSFGDEVHHFSFYRKVDTRHSVHDDEDIRVGRLLEAEIQTG